jgi:acetoin utilization deacetylase AcuC-like enzyme
VCGGGYQEKVTVLSWMVEFLVAMGGSLMRRRWREGQFERLYVMSKKYLKIIT